MFPPFPTERARALCAEAVARISDGTIHLERVSRPSGRDGHGVMVGALLCAAPDGSETALYALSGSSLEPRDPSGRLWAPPVAGALDIEKALAPNDALIHSLTKKINSMEARPGGEREKLIHEREELSARSLAAVHALYNFRCADGAKRNLREICRSLPPTGTGDCCAPKLLNCAFARGLLPLSMDEIYFGESNSRRKNGESYPPCDERCALILPAMLGLDIVWHDSDILVVNKQPGLLSVPGRGEGKSDCVASRARRLFPSMMEQPAPHRLDMETSGLMVLAFTREAHRSLSMQFERGATRKEYVALVDGVIEKGGGLSCPRGGETEGVIEMKIARDWPRRPRQTADDERGKKAVTLWKKLGVESYRPPSGDARRVTRVLFVPLTGRTHQLRLAAADARGFGLPIVGDSLYGSREEGERLALHARFLSFSHPSTGERVSFSRESDF